MSENISYQIKKVDDFCLRDNRWLLLDWRSNAEDFVQLEQELRAAVIYAQKNLIDKIEILLAVEISDDFSQFLYSQNFKPALVELKFDLNKFTESSMTFPNLEFTTQIKNRNSLKKLLVEQAGFHHQILPNYYLSPQEIDWFFYLKQIYYDATKENGLFFLIQDLEDLNALILGDYSGEIAFIWELVVSQEKRRLHLGTFLLNQYLTKIKTLGVKTVYLETMTQSCARGWYEHQGFIDVGQSWFCRLK